MSWLPILHFVATCGGNAYIGWVAARSLATPIDRARLFARASVWLFLLSTSLLWLQTSIGFSYRPPHIVVATLVLAVTFFIARLAPSGHQLKEPATRMMIAIFVGTAASIGGSVLVILGDFERESKIVVAVLAAVLAKQYLLPLLGRVWWPPPPPASVAYDRAIALLKPIRELYYEAGEPVHRLTPVETSDLLMSIEDFTTARRLELNREEPARLNAAIALKEIGIAYRLLGRLANAREAFETALQDLNGFHNTHPSSGSRSALVWCHIEFSDVQVLLGELERAISLNDGALRLIREAGAQDEGIAQALPQTDRLRRRFGRGQ